MPHTGKPLIFLAFANADSRSPRFLKELERERDILDEMLTCPQCRVITKWKTTLGRLESVLSVHKDEVRVFHFAGHANHESLELSSVHQGSEYAYVEGMARHIGMQKGIRLVFLNGCATAAQVKAFQRVGVPAVIATTQPIGDEIARRFAEGFYRSLKNGHSIEGAFKEAEANLLSRFKSFSNLYSRKMEWGGMDPQKNATFPFKLHIHPAHQQVKDQGLADWEKNKKVKPSKYLPPAKVGREIHLLCDRTPQNNHFEDKIKERLEDSIHTPQFFIIQGLYADQPDKLAKRFYEFTIRDIFHKDNKPWKPSDSVRYQIDLPGSRDLADPGGKKPLYRIQENLKKAFGTESIEPIEVLRKIGKRRKLIMIQHNIMVSDWHPRMAEFLATYMGKVWDVELPKNMPRMVILFNLTYPENSLGNLFKFHRHSTIRKSLGRLTEQHTYCTVLEKLDWVTKDDVIQWIYKYLSQTEQVVEQIFHKRKKVRMVEVLPHLRAALERHNQQFLR